MIERVVTFALRQPLFCLLITGIFIGAGIAAFRTLPIEAFPDVTDIQVTVISLYPGQAAEEVERQVTIPLEIGLAGIPNAVRVFAHTQFGLSFLIITFDDGTDDYFARQQVIERLRTVDLPEGVEPQLVPLSTPIGEIYRYRLKSPHRDLMELRSIQDWVVSRQLRMVPGVAEVVSRGGLVKQYQVSLDLPKLRSYNISTHDLFEALERGNANTGGSYIERGEQQLLIRGLGMIRSPDDIEKIIVAERNGTPILIRDIADVGLSAMARQGFAAMDAEPEIVAGIVSMRKGTNPTEVLEGIKERVRLLNESILPKDVRIEPFYDRQWLIDTTLNTVFKNLLAGAVLVGGVLYLFLGNLRLAAIVTLIIPLALLGAFIGLKIRGISANLLSLGALDFGILIDGAVIVAENIFRRLSAKHETRDVESFRAAILESTVQVGRPTFFSMLIIIVAHIPIFTLQRHEGRIFEPMAYTVVSALVGALIFSLTLIPLLSYMLLRKGVGEHDTFVVRLLQRLYRPMLSVSFRRPTVIILGAVVAFAASLALVPRLGTEFLPELDEGNLWVAATLAPSVSLTESQRVSTEVRGILGQFPEVRSVYSQAGRPEDGTDPKMINMIEFLVDLTPPNEWNRPISKQQLAEEMEIALRGIPGLDPSFSQYTRDNVLESISQIKGQIVVKLFGQDLGVLRQKAEEILEQVSGVEGVAYAAIDRVGTVPQLQIQVDREKAARHGLDVSDIQDVIEMGLRGKVATEVWEGESRFELVVRLREQQRQDIDAIRDILVETPAGYRVPLEQVAEIAVRDGSINISRENGSRVTAVSVFLRGRDMGSAVAEMQQRVEASVDIPSGYLVVWGGEFENQQRAMSRLALIVPVTVFLIFVLLFDTFKSVKDAFLILLNVPFALIGGILALFATGMPLSVSAAIGFIALFGVAVLNGVVMVSYFNQLRSTGMPVREAAFEGALVRLRSVSMTAVLAILGFLPVALSQGIGSEVQKPLATVVIGGLVSATTLTLFLLPVLYMLFGSRSADDPGAAEGHGSGI